MVNLMSLTLPRFFFSKLEMSMWYLRMRMWRIILYIILHHMQNDILFYRGREIPAFKCQYSFASGRYMLIAFLGWMILNLVGRIKISIHFTNFKNSSSHRLLYGAYKSFQWGLGYWVDFLENVAFLSGRMKSSSQQSADDALDDSWVPWIAGGDMGWMGRWACIMPWNDEADAIS